MSPNDWDYFEDCCEDHLACWMANFQTRSQAISAPLSASQLWLEWLQAFNAAAMRCVGKKKVCSGSKRWFDSQLRSLRELCTAAGDKYRNAPEQEKPDALLAWQMAKRRARSATKKKRRAALRHSMRALERSWSTPEQFWKRWKARARNAVGASAVPKAVVDLDGALVTDPVRVLKEWRRYVSKLSTADEIVDTSDRRGPLPTAPSPFDDGFATKLLRQMKNSPYELCGDVPELRSDIVWEEVRSIVLTPGRQGCWSGRRPGRTAA